MLFKNKVLAILHEEASLFKSTGPSDAVKSLVGVKQKKLKPYQRKGSRGLNRKNMRQVPNYARGRGDLNSKVEQIRKGAASRVILAPSDIAYIQNRYNIKDIGTGKELGTTGIIISLDPGTGQYILTR